ncbi:phosphotransferase, partial [Leucobacter soli]
GRRAVLRVACTHGYLWVKVVRPSRVERVVEAHRVCSEAGIPVPALLMWSPDGVIVCETADGRPAAETEWRADALLDEVDELRLRLASVRTERPVRGIRSRLDWYASRLGRAAVDAAGDARAVAEIDALVERARRGIAAAVDRAPLVPVHGDLHFGQLFLGDAGRIAGVIDVDTLGLGDRAEDPAAFLGHAIASALLTESELALRVWELADAAAERWGSDPLVPPLTAVHLLGHALGATDRGDERMRAALLRIALAVMDGRPPSEGAR